MARLDDYFSVLNIDSKTTYEDAKSAYRDLASILHPDKHMHNERLRIRATEKFQQLNNAWDYIEKYYKELEAQSVEQESFNKRGRERSVKESFEREEAAKADAIRRAEEEAKYVRCVCPHCGNSNRFSREIPQATAKCAGCKRFLDRELDREEQARILIRTRYEQEEQEHFERLRSKADEEYTESSRKSKGLTPSQAQKKKEALSNLKMTLLALIGIYAVMIFGIGGWGVIIAVFTGPVLLFFAVVYHVGFFGPSWMQ
jgi:curved DNA-binding protein CbpA